MPSSTIPAGMNAWLDVMFDMAKGIWEMPEESWIDDSAKLADIEMLDSQTVGDSDIDKKNLRMEMMAKYRAHQDGVELFVRELPGRTRLLMLGTRQQYGAIPWKFWARVFQAIGHPVKHFLFYASTEERRFPPAGEAVEAEHINGGYSYLCSQSMVVVYRFEEAARVLLHELLHTACFDHKKEIELLEANTEAWTELFLCALLSRGRRNVFLGLWREQCKWAESQVIKLRLDHGVIDKTAYSWRYITGKVDVLKDHGFFLYPKTHNTIHELNLRMTTPRLDSAMD